MWHRTHTGFNPLYPEVSAFVRNIILPIHIILDTTGPLM
jgi:hypothetical protein